MKTSAMKMLPAALVALAVSASAYGQPAPAAGMTDGEVRKVDRDAGKLTLRHGEIRNIDMPPMTMVFQVKDPALLGRLKVGDKVRFRAEKRGGDYVVTAIEPVK